MSRPPGEDFYFSKKTLEKRGWVELRVKGDSMKPIVLDGELVRVERCSVVEIKRFDLVVFERNGGLICHYFWRFDRILGEPEQEFIICRSYRFRKVLDVVKSSELLGRVSSHHFTTWNKLVALFL